MPWSPSLVDIYTNPDKRICVTDPLQGAVVFTFLLPRSLLEARETSWPGTAACPMELWSSVNRLLDLLPTLERI